MKKTIHKAHDRGYFNHGWLETHHSFSFANYYDPQKLNFGALRVLNDDSIQAGTGFGRHPHDNMEIITIPLEGKVLHRDSMGHEQYLGVNEVQVMSAGTGIFHEEYNGSKEENLKLFQIWIIPDKYNITPRYDQKEFDPEQALNNWQQLVAGEHTNGLWIHQSASISRVFLEKDHTIAYTPKYKNNGVYFMLAQGLANIEGTELNTRDAIGIDDFTTLEIAARTDAYLIAIEVPMN